MSTTTVALRAGRHETAPTGLAVHRGRQPASGWRCAGTAYGCQRVDRRADADDGVRTERHQARLSGGGAAAARVNLMKTPAGMIMGGPMFGGQRNRPRRDDGQRADAHADHRGLDPVDSHGDSPHPRRGGKRCSGIGAVFGGRPLRPDLCRADRRRRCQRDTRGDHDAGDGLDRIRTSSTPPRCVSASPVCRWCSAPSRRSPHSSGGRRAPRPGQRWACSRWPHWCAESAMSSTIPAARCPGSPPSHGPSRCGRSSTCAGGRSPCWSCSRSA